VGKFSLNYFISFLSDFGKALNEVASECEKKMCLCYEMLVVIHGLKPRTVANEEPCYRSLLIITP
jgi:hypothetical protein